MDLTTYSTAKAAGQVALAKLNDAYVLSVKQYDPTTGQAVTPLVQAVNKTDVTNQVATLQGQLNSLNALLADLTALG